MTLILSGTNGVSDIDGDASTPALRGTDANSGIYFGSDTVGISAGGTQKLLIGTGSATIDGLTVGRGAGNVSSNTAVGASALAANTSGANNVAVGYQAGYSNTTGQYTTAFGAQALYSNTTADKNAAVGYKALYSNTTGTGNNAFGIDALGLNTTGSNNTAFGDTALGYNTTSGNNTAVGYQALYTHVDSDVNAQNVALGYRAGYLATSYQNTFIGAQAGYSTTGLSHTFVGNGAGSAVTTGSKNTILGRYDGNSGGLDIRTSSNYIVLSDGDGNPRLYYNGSVNGWYSIETYNFTTASATNMCVTGAGAIARSTSALKYKKDIRDLESIDINLFRPVRYKSKCEVDDQTIDRFGIVADEVHEAGITELVTYSETGEVEGFAYDRMVPVLVKAIQELSAKNDALEARIAALEGN